MEPRADRVALTDRAGFASQDQECGLEGILRVVLVMQDLTADAENHRAVPLDEGGEGRFSCLIGPYREPLQELRIVQTGHRPGMEQHLDVPQRVT